MSPHFVGSTDAKWYHVAWLTFRRRQLFKIPAAARFCEQVIERAVRDAGYRVDCVWVGTTGVHLLVRAPATMSRGTLARRLKETSARALRRANVLPVRFAPVWDQGAWCAALTSARGLRAVREHLAARRRLRPQAQARQADGSAAAAQ
ncbi:MAG: transposase [Gemmatimonadales bacterium]|jgi:REP element-mobilizing transposase RayT